MVSYGWKSVTVVAKGKEAGASEKGGHLFPLD
jgi:hypothetical protein